MTFDPKWCGPGAAYVYQSAGLRVLPISPGSKVPLVGGFRASCPDFDWPWDRFPLEAGVAILAGPCRAGGNLHLLGLDLDGAADWPWLEKRLGPLPETLTSKGRRHAWYFVPIPNNLVQRNGLWATETGQLDIRPKAGGYMLEKGDWDAPFAAERIASLPPKALAALEAACAKAPRRLANRPVGEGPYVPGTAPKELLERLAAAWPRPGEGCHDAALALGGILAESRWSAEDCLDFASSLFELAGVKDRRADVEVSLDTRRSGSDAGVYGRTRLREILSMRWDCRDLARRKQNPDRILSDMSKYIPGLDGAARAPASVSEHSLTTSEDE